MFGIACGTQYDLSKRNDGSKRSITSMRSMGLDRVALIGQGSTHACILSFERDMILVVSGRANACSTFFGRPSVFDACIVRSNHSTLVLSNKNTFHIFVIQLASDFTRSDDEGQTNKQPETQLTLIAFTAIPVYSATVAVSLVSKIHSASHQPNDNKTV